MKLILAPFAAVLFACVAQPAVADCKCRARGVIATEGQTLCIWTPGGVRLARCAKVLNNSSWTFLSGTCPQAISDRNESAPVLVAFLLRASHARVDVKQSSEPRWRAMK